MASKTGIQFYVDGTSQKFIRKKQGRKSKSIESIKVPMTTYVLPSTKSMIEERAKLYGMSISAYIETASALFDITQFSTVENCSTHS